MINNLAILFWFYKEPEICRQRLEQIKKHNPNLKVYGLYGGKISEAGRYKKALGKYLDDFYIAPRHSDGWKWINGDLMILDWYEKRGRNLKWESLAICQWDLLVFDSLQKIFQKMKNGQIFFSGLRPLNKEIYNNWDWTSAAHPEDRKNYHNFLKQLKEKYKFASQPLCCMFIFEIFPRAFLRKYSTVKNRELGMLEYKVPCYAKVFNIPFYRQDLKVFWNLHSQDARQFSLNAIVKQVTKKHIKQELKKPNGSRLFHPYFEKWDNQ
jgi:hypothetical protein